jgi:two-component system, cell cycle sensor histidine kinase and response regulator CckA
MEPNSTDPATSRRASPYKVRSDFNAALSPEFLFTQMAATVQDVFWVSAPDLTTLLYASPGFERVWGQPWEQAPHPPAAVIGAAHPEDLTRALKEIRSVQETPRDVEYRILRPDGSMRWIRNRVRAVHDERGQVAMLVGAAADITERKLFQKALIESHARFVTVLDSMDADIYVADFDSYEILFVNRRIEESYGRDLRGRKCWEVFRQQAGPCDRCIQPDLIASDGQPRAGVTWESRSPITGKWYLNYDRAIKWADGRMVRLQIATDISRIKNLETETSRIHAHLQQAQKMEAIGALAGGIAHDFNNILTAILGHTEIAMMGGYESSPANRNLEMVIKAGHRARELVKQILTFSRQAKNEFEAVQIGFIVEEALNLMRSLLPSAISIRTRLHSQSAVMADPTQIHQVIVNLCMNAAHAMQDKGGELYISLEDLNPSPAFFNAHPDLRPGAYQKLTVRDNGHGIAPDMLTSIFEPFFTTKQHGEGTGMGLVVVKGIINSHQGAITVASTVGKGTTFEIFLPIAAAPASVQAISDDASRRRF